MMQDENEFHLPFFPKMEVYEAFLVECKSLYSGILPSENYFYAPWKKNYRHTKVRENRRFTTCDTCGKLHVAIKDAVKNRKDTTDLLNKKRFHYNIVSVERMPYQWNHDRAILNTVNYSSIIVDGADKSASASPISQRRLKPRAGMQWRSNLLVFEKQVRKQRFYVRHDIGTQNKIQSHSWVQTSIPVWLKKKSILPPFFFIQLENSTRENKNRFPIAYLESLVSWGVF